MDALSASYFLKTLLNIGMALYIINIRPKARIGTTAKNISASLPPIINAMVRENISIKGARTATLINII